MSKQITFWIEEGFLNRIDHIKRFSGSSRADIIRRALEYYLKEFTKQDGKQ